MSHLEAVSGTVAPRAAEAPGRRILVVGPLPPPVHGVAVVTRNLLASSVADRFEIIHLDTADHRGVDNIGRLDAGNVWLAGVHGARFLSLLVGRSVDMVYLPVSKNPLGFLRDALFIAPAIMRGIPVVMHFHGGEFDRFVRTAPVPVRALVRVLLRRCARAIVLGESLKPMLMGLIADDRIAAVSNGVTEVPAGSTVAAEERSRVHILFLGNLLPAKGYVELLHAAQQLLDEGLDIEVTFAGAVVDRDVHERALSAVRYGREHIHFVGQVDESAKAVLLRTAHVLALPSEDEAQPLAILEAMSAGLPVISTRRGAIAEMVDDGETGLLVEARAVRPLADALRRLIADPDLRAKLGRAARERYAAHYTLDHWADRMSAVFDDVMRVQAR